MFYILQISYAVHYQTPELCVPVNKTTCASTLKYYWLYTRTCDVKNFVLALVLCKLREIFTLLLI